MKRNDGSEVPDTSRAGGQESRTDIASADASTSQADPRSALHEREPRGWSGPSRPESEIRQLLRFIYSANPFYLVSAGLFGMLVLGWLFSVGVSALLCRGLRLHLRSPFKRVYYALLTSRICTQKL